MSVGLTSSWAEMTMPHSYDKKPRIRAKAWATLLPAFLCTVIVMLVRYFTLDDPVTYYGKSDFLRHLPKSFLGTLCVYWLAVWVIVFVYQRLFPFFLKKEQKMASKELIDYLQGIAQQPPGSDSSEATDDLTGTPQE